MRFSEKERLINEIFDANNPVRQRKAAYRMRYIKNDPEIIRILFGACYEASDVKLQQEAVKSLKILKPEKAIKAFKQSTFNSDAEKRKRAYYHLRTLGIPIPLEILKNGLEDENVAVRRAAVVASGKLGNNYSIIKILKQLLNPYEPLSLQKEIRKAIDNIEKNFFQTKSLNKYHFKEEKPFYRGNTDKYYPKAF
ncbi:hypothetical protein MHK_003924 [Candidatus Magnetomorum sp. HK-1]|nr:hypothetical protein MHK_003924 [Candidatus Magnetomorum sp. HK-1]